MMKKVLCGALTAALVAGSVVAVPAGDASAASVPKAKYTFNMNKKSKNVVAVARKNDTAEFKTSTPKTGALPSTKNVNKKTMKLEYKKGKKGKALYLKRNASFGAQLKGIKLGSSSWTVSFWVKPDSSISDFTAIFFTGNNIVNTKTTKWLSITAASWIKDDNGNHNCPVVWSHNAANGQFPWFAAYDTKDKKGTWIADEAVKKGVWTYVTVAVNAKKTCEYGTKGKDGYVKSYDAWTYVNGKQYGHGTVAKGTMTNKNQFFLGINAWDVPFKGYIDELQLWNKALTAKQAKALYKKMK